MAHAELLDTASAGTELKGNDGEPLERWLPSDSLGGNSLRVATKGEFDRLRRTGMRDQIDRFQELRSVADEGTTKQKKQAKEEFEKIFGQKYNKNLRPPEPAPATISTWSSYRCVSTQRVADGESRPEVLTQKKWDPGLIVFSTADGPRLGLPDALALTQTLRKTVLKLCGVQPAPAWVSGHEEGGNVTKDPHLAFLPLPYVGGRHGDGHLLGLAMAIPAGISASDLRECLGPVFYADTELRTLTLKLGGRGHWELQLEQRPEPPKSLQLATWTSPSHCWESSTPVVLDRFPKTDRRSDPQAWRREVADILRLSCQFAGVPAPRAVDVDTSAFLAGVPRATPKARRPSKRAPRAHAGEGFPPFVSRAGKPSRPQVHVRLWFDQPVTGPVLLGAGRFLGYGFFKPATKARIGGSH